MIVTIVGSVAVNNGPRLKAWIGGFFTPELSRVDRATITGCKSILANDSPASEKAVKLAAARCERYSDRQFAQIERDVQKCYDNAAKGDEESNRCLDAARRPLGYAVAVSATSYRRGGRLKTDADGCGGLEQSSHPDQYTQSLSTQCRQPSLPKP